MEKPDLYRYLDFRAFLRDWFAWRCEQDPKFSRRQFARLAGKRSPGLLTTVMEGERRLTPPMVRAFAGAMDLGAEESAFFSALVQLEQATTTQARNEAWNRVSATRAFREARPLQGASVEYLSHWWYPVVRELAYRHDFRPDPAWIARRIRPTITEPQARAALEALQTLGMLVEADNGAMKPADGLVTTPHEVAGLAAHNYHHGMLDRAIEAIEAYEPADRHMVAATIPVPDALIPELKQEINALQQRVLDLSEQHADQAQRVVQVHLVLFPLSDASEEEVGENPESPPAGQTRKGAS